MQIMEATDIKKFFFGLYSRKHCYKLSDNVFVKNLSMLGFPSSKTIFVDVSLSFIILENIIDQCM